MNEKTSTQERKYFGTDGIRALANQYPMSPDVVLKLGMAIGLYFKKRYPNPKILIGKDTRRSGYLIEQVLGAGICAVGVDVLQLGPLPTAGIAYLTRGLRACAGIVISASHNSFEDNGIKIFNYDGYKLPDEIELELEELLSTINFDNLPTGMGIGRAKRIEDAVGQYAVFLKEQFPKKLSLEGVRIVLDCANGAAYKVAPKVFEELGAEIFKIGVKPNGYNINERCGALFPENLAEKVKLYKANIGIALDGDADRLIVVDENGSVVDGDEILAICALYMLKNGELADNTLVSTVMSNQGLEEALKSKGGTLLRTQVGDRYVVEAMKKGEHNLGGEASGHLIFRDCSTTGDGILAALNLLKIVVETGQSVGELRRVMTKYPQVMRNIPVNNKPPIAEVPELQAAIEEAEKMLAGQGRVLFRYSGTEKLARVMVEAKDLVLTEKVVSFLAEKTRNILK